MYLYRHINQKPDRVTTTIYTKILISKSLLDIRHVNQVFFYYKICIALSSIFTTIGLSSIFKKFTNKMLLTVLTSAFIDRKEGTNRRLFTIYMLVIILLQSINLSIHLSASYLAAKHIRCLFLSASGHKVVKIHVEQRYKKLQLSSVSSTFTSYKFINIIIM